MQRLQNLHDEVDAAHGHVKPLDPVPYCKSLALTASGHKRQSSSDHEGLGSSLRSEMVRNKGLMDGYVDEWRGVRIQSMKQHGPKKQRRTKADKERERIQRESAWYKEYWATFPSDEQIEREMKEYFKDSRLEGVVYVAKKGDGPLMFGLRSPKSLETWKTKAPEENWDKSVHRSMQIGNLNVVKVDRRVFKKLVQCGAVITGGPVQGSGIPLVQHDWRGQVW